MTLLSVKWRRVAPTLVNAGRGDLAPAAYRLPASSAAYKPAIVQQQRVTKKRAPLKLIAEAESIIEQDGACRVRREACMSAQN
jgi:hypothetical protein